MGQVFHSKPEQTRTLMTRREPDAHSLVHLGGEAQSVLAVLTMAALWPSRFPEGWVTVHAFAENGLLLGDRADRESLKAAIRRGVRQTSQVSHGPRIECRRTLEHDAVSARLRRDWDRRLIAPPGPDLEQWLLRTGADVISPVAWKAFFPTVGSPKPDMAPVARGLLRHALQQAEACLALAALRVPPRSPEGITLQRIRQTIGRGIAGAYDGT